MAIIRTTQTIGLPIQEQGTKEWGSILNDGLEKIDLAFLADRNRISSLETLGVGLPGALAGKIGHNVLRNNIFQIPVASSPNLAAFWTSQFYNGALGNTSRDSSTQIQGTFSLRISIVNVDTSPSAQTRPYPGLNVLDPETDQPLATTDLRQLTNGFGVNYQTVNLLPRTVYTLSCYGKSDVQNLALGINNHWKVGIVFKTTTGDVIHSYFTQPQTNRTNLTASSSFQRVELTFSTPNIPIVNAEVWIVCEGSTPGGIGSSWFGGVQLEQASRASNLETFAFRGGDLFVDGDFIVSGNLTLQQQFLTFDSDEIKLLGNVQIGDSIVLDTLDVYTKQSIFHGPLTVQGNTSLGDSISDRLDVQVGTTTFFSNQDLINPQGGNVVIQGTLNAQGDVVLGSSSSTNTVTINANLVTTGNDLEITNDLDVGGSLTVDRGVELGSNQPLAGLVVKMSSLGSSFEGDVVLNNDLEVKGSTTLGDGLSDSLTVEAGFASFAGTLEIEEALSVFGPVSFDMGSSSSDNFTISGNKLAASLSDSVEFTTPLLKTSGSLQVNNGLTANFSLSGSSIASSGAKVPTLDLYSLTTSISDNLSVGGNLSLTGNLTSTGTSFQLGSAFSANALGALTIGDSSSFSAPSYGNQLRVYAGTTFFGDRSLQRKGNVEVGGDLLVAGNTVLGSSTSEDTLTISVSSLDLNLGSSFRIGGGFQNNTYNPSATDHGGITLDKNGNLSLDGKLTVKGPFDPVSILINPQRSDGSNTTNVLTVSSSTLSPTTTFNLTSSGDLALAKSFSIKNGTIANLSASSVSFGLGHSPVLASFDAYASFINLTGNTSVTGNLATSGSLSAGNITGSGSLLLSGNASIQGDITSLGYNFVFGQSNSLASSFKIFANDVEIGVGTQNKGNLIVGNNLNVNNSFTVGDIGVYDGEIRLSGSKIDIDVSSRKTDGLELAGFRVGGGFQNNPYNSTILDHGGVTIDAYGNIFADGDIFTRGSVSYDKLILTVGGGENPFNPVVTIINNNIGQGDTNLTIDGYGNIHNDGFTKTDGYLYLTGLNTTYSEPGPGLGTPTGESSIVLRVDRVDQNVTYGEYFYGGATYSYKSVKSMDIDDLGTIRTDGFILMNNPHRSNLSSHMVTVGDGVTTFGDFNKDGYFNQYQDPIKVALDYFVEKSYHGTLFIKRGNYTLSQTLQVPENVIILGEGIATNIDCDGYSVGFELLSNAGIQDVKISNASTGLSIPASASAVRVFNVEIDTSTLGINLAGDSTIVKFCSINSTTGVQITGDNNIVTENTIVATTDYTNSGTLNSVTGSQNDWSITALEVNGTTTVNGSLNVAGNGRGIVPLGAIIPMTTGLTGAMAVPASGVVSNGWIRCDGAAIPGGNTVSGTTPNLTGSIYLRGASTYGGTGGNNTTTLSTTNLPSHTHANTLTNATVGSSSHAHNYSHVHQWGNTEGTNEGGLLFKYLRSSSSTDINSSSIAGNNVVRQAAFPAPLGGVNTWSFAPTTDTLTSWFTSGVSAGVSGTGASANTGAPSATTTVGITNASTGSGTAFSTEPNYINVIYMIRVN